MLPYLKPHTQGGCVLSCGLSPAFWQNDRDLLRAVQQWTEYKQNLSLTAFTFQQYQVYCSVWQPLPFSRIKCTDQSDSLYLSAVWSVQISLTNQSDSPYLSAEWKIQVSLTAFIFQQNEVYRSVWQPFPFSSMKCTNQSDSPYLSAEWSVQVSLTINLYLSAVWSAHVSLTITVTFQHWALYWRDLSLTVHWAVIFKPWAVSGHNLSVAANTLQQWEVYRHNLRANTSHQWEVYKHNLSANTL